MIVLIVVVICVNVNLHNALAAHRSRSNSGLVVSRPGYLPQLRAYHHRIDEIRRGKSDSRGNQRASNHARFRTRVFTQWRVVRRDQSLASSEMRAYEFTLISGPQDYSFSVRH